MFDGLLTTLVVAQACDAIKSNQVVQTRCLGLRSRLLGPRGFEVHQIWLPLVDQACFTVAFQHTPASVLHFSSSSPQLQHSQQHHAARQQGCPAGRGPPQRLYGEGATPDSNFASSPAFPIGRGALAWAARSADLDCRAPTWLQGQWPIASCTRLFFCTRQS